MVRPAHAGNENLSSTSDDVYRLESDPFRSIWARPCTINEPLIQFSEKLVCGVLRPVILEFCCRRMVGSVVTAIWTWENNWTKYSWT